MIEASVYNKCVRCGLCLPSCPTYLETLTETSGPRGRIALIRAVDEGSLDPLSPGFVHQMSECLDCRACADVCPSGVEYGRLVEGARALIESKHAPDRSPPARLGRMLALKTLFAHLGLMRAAAIALRFYQRCGLQYLARTSGLLRLLRLEAAEALAPKISDAFFVPRGQHFKTKNSTQTVMLHAGCIMQVAFAEVNDATVRVLARNACSVVVPKAQGCCGAIALHAGEVDFARELARRNIAAFESSGAQFCIANAAGCGSTFKEYGSLLQDDLNWSERARAFSTNVRDALEFLDAKGLAPGLSGNAVTATYQDPCHLAHAQRVSAAPRRLLAQIPGLTLREMPESGLCCGSAGIYNLTQPEMSARLRTRKVEHVVATQAEVVATANPGCAMQLQTGLRERGSAMRVTHVIELIDRAYTQGLLSSETQS